MKFPILLSLFIFQFLFIFNLPAQIWTKTHDLGIKESGFEINALSDGNFLVSGKEWGFPEYSSKYMFTKIDTEGEVLWNKVYQLGHGGSSYSNIYTFPLSLQEGYFAIGNSYEMISSDSYGDIFLLRLDEHGDSLWTKIIGTEVGESLSAAFLTEDEQHVVFFYTSYDSSSGSRKYYLSKIDLEGSVVWNHELQINTFSVIYSIVPTPDGNFLASGFRKVDSENNDALAFKINHVGNILWENTYGGSGWDFFFDLEINKDGNPLFFGTTGSTAPKGFYLLETDWNGDILSEKVVPSPNGGILAAPHPRMEVLKLANDGFVISADSQLGSCGDDASQIYWLDNEGNYINSKILAMPDFSIFFYNAAQSLDGDIVVCGGIYNYLEGSNLLLVKFENQYITHTRSAGNESIELKISPNPFTQYIHLEIPEMIELPLTMEFSDLNGKILFSEPVVEHQLKIEAAILNSGIYFLKVYSKDLIRTFKVIKN